MPSLRGGDRMPHACFNLHASSQLQSSADNVCCLAVTVPALRTQSQSFILIYFPRSTQHSVFAAFRKSSTDCGSTSSGSLTEPKHRTCSEKSRSRSAGGPNWRSCARQAKRLAFPGRASCSQLPSGTPGGRPCWHWIFRQTSCNSAIVLAAFQQANFAG